MPLELELINRNQESWLKPNQAAEGVLNAGARAFRPVSALELIDMFPILRPPVVQGLLREGEVMNLVGAPKARKSWLAQMLLGAVACGRPWLGMTTTRGKVLLIDAELHEETLARRLARLRDVYAISPEDLAGQIQVEMVRGERLTIDRLAELLGEVPAGEYKLVVLDALYRFYPDGGEENSNETMVRIYNALDALARRLRCAIVVVHHSTKGVQSAKSVTDMGSGGGAQSRAADTHLVLRDHEEPDAMVVEAVVRSWPPLAPFTIHWADTTWQLAPELDPSLLKQGRSTKRREKRAEPAVHAPIKTWTPQTFAAEFIGETPAIKEEIFARAAGAGLSKSQAKGYLERAMEDQHAFRHICPRTSRHRFSTRPQSAAVGYMAEGSVAHTQPPELHALGGCGGERARPPSPPGQPDVPTSKGAKTRRVGGRG